MGHVVFAGAPSSQIVTAVGAVILAGIHVLAAWFETGEECPRGLLSLAGGVSVAYVFLHILPSLRLAGEAFVDSNLPMMVTHEISYLVALVGFTGYYGLEQFVTESDDGLGRPSPGVYRVHLLSFAAYNALFGYLLAQREADSGLALWVFVLTVGLHLVVVDFGLVRHHADRYRRRGRWVLAVSVLLGAAVGLLLGLHPIVIEGVTAFLGGAIVLNSIKEELPAKSESSFRIFALAATAYGLLLVFA